jgi:hypothetical protein
LIRKNQIWEEKRRRESREKTIEEWWKIKRWRQKLGRWERGENSETGEKISRMTKREEGWVEEKEEGRMARKLRKGDKAGNGRRERVKMIVMKVERK